MDLRDSLKIATDIPFNERVIAENHAYQREETGINQTLFLFD